MVPADCVLFGEISLSGSVRPVAQGDLRLKEAMKMGFTRAWLPPRALAGNSGKEKISPSSVEIVEIEDLGHLVARLAQA